MSLTLSATRRTPRCSSMLSPGGSTSTASIGTWSARRRGPPPPRFRRAARPSRQPAPARGIAPTTSRQAECLQGACAHALVVDLAVARPLDRIDDHDAFACLVGRQLLLHVGDHLALVERRAWNRFDDRGDGFTEL